MKRVIDGAVKKIAIGFNQIARDVKTKKLLNNSIVKEFKLDYDKRMVLPEKEGIIDTLPWGY